MNFRHVIIFLVTIFFFPFVAVFGEGSKQLSPDTVHTASIWIPDPAWNPCFASPACDDDHKLFVRVASASEKIYLGFGTTSLVFRITKNGTVVFGPKVITINAQGYIKYYSQAIAGPNVVNVHGYNAIQFAPGSPGDYSIEFDPGPEIKKFDITVIDTATAPLAAIDGRLSAKYWPIETATGPVTPPNPFPATMFIYSDDSVVTSINFNNMLAGGVHLTANRNGLFPPPALFDTSRMSRSGPYFYPQYKIFLCNPDVNQFPTGTNGLIQNGVVVTPQCDGSVMLNFSASKPGVVNIEIEINPLPGHQPEDVTLTEPVATGPNTIIWNGMNGLGVAVPSGAVIGINISYVNGLTNVALYSVQSNLNGFIVQLVRPPGPPIAMYWDDIKLSFWGGVTQLDGCYSVLPSTGCHAWDGGKTWGLGWAKTINSWWYSASSNLNLGNFTIVRTPVAAVNIFGSLQPCLYSTETYTVQPDPLPGADQNKYNWVLTDAGTGNVLMDVLNMGTTINIDFSNYPPGQKWLKVRGNSTACGFGQFGPAPNGILINSIQPTQVINTVTTFSICSGEQTDILLEASSPTASFDYTASSTSPLVSGFFPDNVNPIHQTLVNVGTDPETVIYHVVPFATPCYGTETDFYVIVNPYLSTGVSIAVSSNPVCTGTSVTFTATPTNGGATPHYQWKVNGTNSGPDSPLFTFTPNNNDVISCTITSSQVCVTGSPAESNPITMSVIQSLPVSVSVSTPSNTVCNGTSVSFTASPLNEGSSPGYQWYVNGSNAGTNSPVFTYVPMDNDMVSCHLTSSEACAIGNPANSNTIAVHVNPNLPVSVSVAAYSNPVCSGTTVTYTAAPVNGGLTPAYQWNVNGVFSGTNSPTFIYIPDNNDIVTCIVTSSEACASGNPSTSNQAVMTVTPNLPVSISISTPSTTFCTGSPVTITATSVNGGTSPNYQWSVNAINVNNANNAVFTYMPVNGDAVTCVLSSSDVCVAGNPATSNTLNLTGTATLPAGINIMAEPNPFCQGSQVTYTATPVNGGTNPIYQWKVNGINASNASNAVFSYTPANNDVVHCEIISNLNCVTGNPAISPNVLMIGKLSPVVSFASCFDTVTTENAKPFKLKGGLPYGGSYSGPGVDQATGIFTPTFAGSGLKTISYSYTNVLLCSDFKSRTILVQPTPAFVCGSALKDIRDNKIYPTVLIGSQCWMASNLNYGTTVQSSRVQSDNCISEKHCYYDLAGNCNNYGGLYQWDEMMKYEDTPAAQGLCPPGWHVPTDTEWTILMNNYQGNALAGKPLQDSVFYGFSAVRSGVFYLNSSMSFEGFATLFWTSTPDGQFKSISHGVNSYNFSVSLYPSSRSNAFPVRCLRD
jgi:uncharacterized protein (TIGR02145 family)